MLAGPGASSSLHQPTQETSASLADQLRHVSWTEGFASASQPYRVPILGITFLRIATTNKPGAINPSIFCLFGFIFPKELLLWFVHHMYTGLSNGG